MTKIRRGSIAFLLSMITPGLGHIYNGQLFTGILLIITYDSRHYGFVGVPKVAGKALYVYYSSSDTGRIGHAIQ